MSALAATLGTSFSDHPMRKAFLRWQCHVRQLTMRTGGGKPDDGMMPQVWIGAEMVGHIITVLNKTPEYSVTAELSHMAAKELDPAKRRDQALRFLSATHYQKAAQFSDVLTATFPPGSAGAARLIAASRVRLVFDAYAQRFDLRCTVSQLARGSALYRATWAHNFLFNPALPPGTEVLAFEPDWSGSSSDPELS